VKIAANILFLSQTAANMIPRLEREFSTTDIKVKFLTSADPKEVDFIMVDYALIEAHYEKLKILLNFPEKLSIITSLADHVLVNEILKKTRATNLFGLSGPNTLSDFRDYVLCKKLNYKWETSTFIKEPSYKKQIYFETSANLQEKLEDLLSQIDLTDCFEGIENYLSQIMNELLTNALYNAPTDSSGNFKFRETNRKEIVKSEPNKIPFLEFTMDQNKICFKVTDFYGSLTQNNIFEFLTKGIIQEKKGGAGIGLYLAFKYCHKLIINIEQNKYTEILIVIEKDKRFKRYSTKEKSFHLFLKEESNQIEL
jgi:hypothetical protein